jgi:hypothetical protein
MFYWLKSSIILLFSSNALLFFVARSSWGQHAKQLAYINTMVWYNDPNHFMTEFDAAVPALSAFCGDVDRSHGCFWADNPELGYNSMDVMSNHMRQTFAPGLPGMYFLCISDLGLARPSEIQGSHFLPMMHEHVWQIILNVVCRTVLDDAEPEPGPGSPPSCVPWGVFDHVCYANDFPQDGCLNRGDWFCPYTKPCEQRITHFEFAGGGDDDDGGGGGGAGLTDPGVCYGTPTFEVLPEVEAAARHVGAFASCVDTGYVYCGPSYRWPLGTTAIGVCIALMTTCRRKYYRNKRLGLGLRVEG